MRTPDEELIQIIESHTRDYMRRKIRSAFVFLNGEVPEDFSERVPSMPLTVEYLEQLAPQWASIVPGDFSSRATLVQYFVSHYPLDRELTPNLWNVLDLHNTTINDGDQLYQAALQVVSGQLTNPEPVLMESVEKNDLTIVQKVMETIRLGSGEVLFHDGDPGDSMYVISSGRVRVVFGENEATPSVIERGLDGIIGEMALLTGETRTTTISALRDTELFRISKADFESITKTRPEVTSRITQMIVTRLRDETADNRTPETIRTIAVLPAGTPGNISVFSTDLVETLSTQGDILHLSSTDLDREFYSSAADTLSDTLENIRISGWMNQQSEKHRYLILEGDTDLSGWTKCCIRQADRIFLVGEAGGSPQLNQIENALASSEQFNQNIHKELVLLHETIDQPPHNTRAWLELRDLKDHHHIAQSNAEHMARLKRYLIDKPIALVFSGGSIRAFAHIGVLRALRESNIPVDIICGTSAGALIAAQFAMGWDDTRLETENKRIFRRAMRFFDYTLPISSFIGGKRFNKVFQEIFENRRIEDLWIKYFCITVDLTEAKLLVHREGEVWRYVRGSCSVPAFLPPLLENGHLLVDGGLINNIPINQMLEIAGNAVLLCSDTSTVYYAADAGFNYGDSLSFWKILANRLNPFAKKLILPNIIGIMLRSLEIGSIANEPAQIAKADVYIRPNVEEIAYTDTNSISRLVALGYKAAIDKLTTWSNS
jgi:predicted acylesterase/phospholipase RssA/CRP-like cAMP-binding protein